MSRYKVVSDWELDYENVPFTWYDYDTDTTHVVAVEVADIEDTKNGQQYRAGAYRVVEGEGTGMFVPNGSLKPIKRGKGGTVPFYGESAWSDAARLFNDEVFKARRLAY